MLTFRIQMHNPGAEFVSIARLDVRTLDLRFRYGKPKFHNEQYF